MKKRILGLLLTLVMVLSLVPTAAFASIADSGKCGDNLKWTLSSTGTLTISGTGKMADYPSWDCSYTSVKKVIIESGVTSIGKYAFEDLENITSVSIPSSVTEIKDGAFWGCDSLKTVVIPDSVQSIGDSAFYDCGNLNTVVLGTGVTYISDIFGRCPRLAKIVIPASVTEIDFYGSNNIETVYYGGGEEDWQYISDDVDELENATVHFHAVPKADAAVAATCEKSGLTKGYHCSECGETIIAQSSISAKGHSYTDKVVEPTFAKEGYTLHKCDTCGDSHKDNYKAKKTLAQPVISSATNSSSGITVKWKKVTNASGYYIYRSKNGGSYVKIDSVGSSKLSYKDANAIGKGTKYSYKIVAYAKENGTTYTSVKSAGKSPSFNIKLNKSSVKLCKGKTATLTTVTYPAKSAVTWSSGNKAVAKVSSTGVITAVAKGTATITAKFKQNGKIYKATCKVTVTNPSIKLNKTSAAVGKGSSITLKATTNPSGVTVKWSSSNSSIAKVSSTGKVTGVSMGKATIKAKFTYQGKTYTKTCPVTVKFMKNYSGSGANWVEKKLVLPAKTKLTITMNNRSTDEYDRVWVDLSDPEGYNSYFTQGKYEYGTYKGTVTVPAGTYTLTIDSDGPYKVSLSGAYIPTISKTKMVLGKGCSETLKVTGTNCSYKWSSSNTSVASVNSKGKVTAKANGTATITCKLSNGQKLTCKVTVKNKVTASVTYCKDVAIYNDVGVKISNNTNKNINYVTLKIYQYDNRGYALDSPYDYWYVNDTIAAHDYYSGVFWVNDNTRSAKVKILKVWFTDGTTWTP